MYCFRVRVFRMTFGIPILHTVTSARVGGKRRLTKDGRLPGGGAHRSTSARCGCSSAPGTRWSTREAGIWKSSEKRVGLGCEAEAGAPAPTVCFPGKGWVGSVEHQTSCVSRGQGRMDEPHSFQKKVEWGVDSVVSDKRRFGRHSLEPGCLNGSSIHSSGAKGMVVGSAVSCVNVTSQSLWTFSLSFINRTIRLVLLMYWSQSAPSKKKLTPLFTSSHVYTM